MKALIKKGKKFFRFVLIGVNGEPVATSESYTRKETAIQTLQVYFPTFQIVDKTV